MKKFKAESQRVLDIMINSIYTHKEIFLRELISNASDAIDKLYYKSLNENLGLAKEDFKINITSDSEKRILTISDNGIGMTSEQLEDNLGIIAKSGSLDFKKAIEKSDDINIIGQFGVGFYSAFMVSDKVEVISRAYGAEDAYIWSSTGSDGYDIKKTKKEEAGTTVVLHIKKDEGNEVAEDYDSFLDEYTIRDLVKKYSDYIRYPIKLTLIKDDKDENNASSEDDIKDTQNQEDIEKDEKDFDILNSMIPIWKKRKSDITESEYFEFYKNEFHDFKDPLRVIHTNVEGAINYTALLFIPARAPYNYYGKSFEKGLKLYTNNVMIMEKSKELIPDFFGFVSGLVDTDITLNISRETVQHNSQLRKIASNLEKKIKSELLDLLENDREKYETFYDQFSVQLKYGIYESFGANKDVLIDLIMFKSVQNDKLITLKEYVNAMKEDQKYIYYACGNSVAQIKAQPQAELVLDSGYDILLFTDDVDEFAIKMIEKYALDAEYKNAKEFKSISASGDLGLTKPETTEEKSDDSTLTDFIKETLGDKVSDVRVSSRLKNHPVCLIEEGDISMKMEKVLQSMPNNNDKIRAKVALEINAQHPIYLKLKNLFENDKDTLKEYAAVLYEQARLIEGLSIESPSELASSVITLLAK
ncbi:MAG: molecular chaperone HtpG [Christensenellaceae bacterium]|jgi:molecular chaperone HtpG|nr:molecular chaperone HtpG [Christensenellaceae bacterium]